MPAKPSLAGSSSTAAEATHEVLCPLNNNDGSICRKRCFGEKRFRSMQEHIRRAHPDYYISKLPATEESFLLMVNSDPSQRPIQNNDNGQQHPHSAFAPLPYVESYLTNHDGSPGFMQDPGGGFYDHNTSPQMFSHHDARRPSFVPTANAAAALAQLHNSRPENDWDVDPEQFPDPMGDQGFPNYFANSESNIFTDAQTGLPSDSKDGHLLPASFPSNSRAASQQPFSRPKQNRPRKSSVTENARKGKHERQRSKDHKRISGDRKTLSAESGALIAAGKRGRWEDLLDAAASATEEDSRDLTPIPQSPRGSVPPFQGQNHTNQFQSYHTSPLQNTILPHSPDDATSFEPPSLEAFPSVEARVGVAESYQPPFEQNHNSSADSSISNPFNYPRPGHQHQSSTGSNFHIPQSGLSSSPNDLRQSATAFARQPGHSHSWSAPNYDSHARSVSQQGPPAMVQHYCAACHRIAPLMQSFACTECICGICRECVDVLNSMASERDPRCPSCHMTGVRFKPFSLDLR